MYKFFIIGVIIGVAGGLLWKKWRKYIDSLPTGEDIIEEEYSDGDGDD